MNTKHSQAGVAAQIGLYSDGVEVPSQARWLYTAGTPGLRPDGTLPETFEEQVEQTWRNILTILESASMGVEDIVKVTQYLMRREDIQANAAARNRFLDGARPTSMMSVVAGLVRPEFLVEIEVYAAKM
jgi:2-iminobutanoate/2-iminopropanoate deaminase